MTYPADSTMISRASKQRTPQVLYIMGAGRSGSTALAIFLGAASKIRTLGEMHQFFEHLQESKPCSCGAALPDCSYWGPIVLNIPDTLLRNRELRQRTERIEGHTRILLHLIRGLKFFSRDQYFTTQRQIFNAISKQTEEHVLVDSAKYIGRALTLRQLDGIDFKVVYLVRDPRGVVYSFSKSEQTGRGFISSILYYVSVNFTAEIVRSTALKGKVIKVRYEDIISNPHDVFKRLETFTGVQFASVAQAITENDSFRVGHIIGGNRLRETQKIIPCLDNSWKFRLPVWRRVLVWTLTLPFNIINRYHI